ncbi:MAG TPA: ABC transporter permease [Anaeromyxobacter sp.]|nr:ABC transporter permease [Anaeromyxobacter sp.]HVO18376.1 ABC transporter permease [Anaeromyxobacter sp.]
MDTAAVDQGSVQVGPAAGRLSNESFITFFMIAVLIGLFGMACAFVPNFFLPRNVLNLLTNYWYIIILGIGVTFLLVTGNFDMSVGGNVALTGVVAAWACQAAAASPNPLAVGLGLPYGVAVALALCCAVGVGAVNAFFIVRLRVPSIIVTLGTMMLSRGLAQVITRGAQRNTSLPEVFGVIGNTFLPGTPVKVAVLIMVALVAVASVVEKATVSGRRTYLIGANAEAARLSGLKVGQHVARLYLLSGLLAGITGILLSSEFKAGVSGRASGYEFDALVITLLGGVSISGGFGSVLGMFVGAIILSVVTSAATGLLLSPDWQFTLKGVVTFLAILAQRFALDRRNG